MSMRALIVIGGLALAAQPLMGQAPRAVPWGPAVDTIPTVLVVGIDRREAPPREAAVPDDRSVRHQGRSRPVRRPTDGEEALLGRR